MPGVGAKGMSWKKAMADAKKKNPQNIREAEGPSPREEDRSPNEIPTQSMRARMMGYYPPATKRYNDAAKMGLYRLNEGQVALAKSGPEGKEAVASMEGKSVDEINSALPRKMAFCGGSSKPYKKK